MDIKLEKKAAFTVVGMKYRGKAESNEIPQLWNQFLPRASEIQNRVNMNLCFGAENNSDDVTGEFDYLACVQVSHLEALPEGMEKWEIPANHYAIFPTTLPNIKNTFTIIESNLTQAGLELGSGIEFELYDETFNPQDPTSLLYVHVPIKKNVA